VSGVKLSVYFGERDRAGDRFLADALCDIFAAHELATSLVMRGTTGFGAKQHLRTDRLLTLSEDLPLVAVGVDARERIDAALRDVQALAFDGLVTLERAGDEPPPDSGAAKLTVYMGRREPYDAVVAALHRHGVAGATVLLGVDGTAHGERRRARFLGRNAGVPLMVVSVGEAAALGRDPRHAGARRWRRVAEDHGLRQPPALSRARALAARVRCGGRDHAARRVGLPRRSHPARRERLAAAAERAGRDRGRRPARERGALVGAARRADRRDRAGDERARTDRASPGGLVG
jgi:PII-like signaling protein